MSARDVRGRIARRAQRAGIQIPADRLAQLDRYVELLCLWNRRINLTSLGLEPVTDEAIDRLVVEPIVASRYVIPAVVRMVDIGSGGGSPAIPLRVCLPGVRAILVEVKVRKAAFLREVIRQLALENVEVENRRFEELLARTELHETIDLVTIRAVRGDRRLWMAVQGFLRPGGQVFWFGGATGEVETLPTFELVGRETLTSANGSVLTVLRRR